MIRSSFIFLERIGLQMERKIWRQGITTWNDFLSCPAIHGISSRSKAYYDRQIRLAEQRLYHFDSHFFSSRLPSTETWRLYDFFSDEAVFLDIETSGASSHDDITMVGLFDGIDTKIMIRGINLDILALTRELARYKLILTFNGSSFDLPFLAKRYPGVIPAIPHIDVRHLCEKIGLTGGLKEIEKKLGLKRDKIIERFYGGDPYRLWRIYRVTGDDYYLQLLISYNEDDVINLKTIAEQAIKQSAATLTEIIQNESTASSKSEIL